MRLFCLNGYQGEKISMELNEVIGFPNSTSYDGGYDIIRLVLLSEKNIGGRFLSFDSAVSMLTSFVPFVPIWINVSFQKKEDEVYFFELETSYRIRKPSLLRNIETGHPPFKASKK